MVSGTATISALGSPHPRPASGAGCTCPCVGVGGALCGRHRLAFAACPRRHRGCRSAHDPAEEACRTVGRPVSVIRRALRCARRPVACRPSVLVQVVHPATVSASSLVPIWVGDTQFAKYLDLEPLHQRGIAVTVVIVAQQMQGSMNDQVRHVVRQTVCPAPRPRARRSPRRSRCRPALRLVRAASGAVGAARRRRSAASSSAGQDSTLVGAGLPRKSAFSAAMRASSQASSAISQASRIEPEMRPAPRARGASRPAARQARRHSQRVVLDRRCRSASRPCRGASRTRRYPFRRPR